MWFSPVGSCRMISSRMQSAPDTQCGRCDSTSLLRFSYGLITCTIPATNLGALVSRAALGLGWFWIP